MADDLKRLVQPDERVLFETGVGGGAGALALLVGAVAVPAVTAFGTAWLGGGKLWSALIGAGGGALPTLLFAGRGGGAALVTDIRVIYRQGTFRPRVTEIPLWHIAEIKDAGWRVTLAGRGGETYRLPSLPEQEKLALAILRQTRVPAPDKLKAAAEEDAAAAEHDDGREADDD